MSQQSPYATNKLLAHPDHIKYLAAGEHVAPLQIQLMPQNLCNHDCGFCSYRLSNWKNSTLFDEKNAIPLDVLDTILDDATSMGVKAFEVTGGGEPLIYRHKHHLFERLVSGGFDIGLVTNGTAFDPETQEILDGNLLWARVSLDTTNPETMVSIRSVDPKQLALQWDAVTRLVAGRKKPEQRVGVGFVLVNENIGDVYEVCKVAKDHGADNVRLSLRFGPEGNAYYSDQDALFRAFDDAERAKRDLDDDSFLVVNLLRERYENQAAPFQDYHRCLSKDLMCVIGGDSKVYYCCTLAFHPSGLVGDLREQRFKDLWYSPRVEKMYRDLDPRRLCMWTCLYEQRNKEMLRIVEAPKNIVHRNFI